MSIHELRLQKGCGEGDSGKALKEIVDKRLFDQRIVSYSQVVTRESAQLLISQLLCLSGESPTEPIRLFLNCPGGDADSGFAIYDAIKFIQTPVDIVCAGLAASAAVLVLVATEKERRYSLPHARVMIHQPSSGAHGDASDLQIEAAEILKCRATINEVIARETGQKMSKVEEDVRRNLWLSAEEALEYGLVSKIIERREDLGL